MKWTKEHISIDDNYVNVTGLGVAGLWWPKYDKKVCISYGFGESFYAATKGEIIIKVLEMLNKHNEQN